MFENIKQLRGHTFHGARTLQTAVLKSRRQIGFEVSSLDKNAIVLINLTTYRSRDCLQAFTNIGQLHTNIHHCLNYGA